MKDRTKFILGGMVSFTLLYGALWFTFPTHPRPAIITLAIVIVWFASSLLWVVVGYIKYMNDEEESKGN
jgi:hypothetical protein